jgi:transcriptional regulator with XRE-family HTH domain
MRPSSKRTTVAALRTTLGLSVEQFSKLIGKSVSTVKSLETPDRLKLSEDTAMKISDETGISARWLLEGDPDKPMIADSGWAPPDKPAPLYYKSLFEHIQATAQAMAKDQGRKRYLRHQKRDAQSLELCSQWFGILAAARKDGKQEVAEYLFGQFIDQMKKRFGYESARKRDID